MPIYEYNGKRYNIPEAKAQELTARMPGAKLINEAPYYLADNPSPQPPSMAQINLDVPEVNPTTFDGEIARQTAGKQLGGGVSLGQKQSIADITGDMYGNRELTLPDHKNAAQKQEGFWASGLGDALEKLGAGAVRTIAGFGQVGKQSESTMVPGEKIEGDNIKRSEALQGWFGAANTLSERGDRYGVMIDPETGETRKKTYADLWKEGKPLAAAGEALLTATESAPTSIMAMLPGGLPLIAVTSAGQKYNEIENNPDTKGLPEWKKVLNASFSGALEGLTEKLGAKVDVKVFEPVLKKMGEQTVKDILKKGGIGALIQTITEGGEEVISQLGGNVVDYATGVTDEYKPFEGVRDSFVYGAAGGAQFGGLTGAGTIYRAVEQHKANVETAKVKNTMRLWESINNKQSQALPALNNEKQQLEAELGDLTDLTYEEVAGSPEATPELVEARRRYDIVNAEYEGVMENLKREVDDFIAPQIQAIQDVSANGVITELNIGTEEIPDIVYLTGGNIAINEDGTIDPAGTAPLLTVKNSEGKKRLISRKRIVTAQQDDLDTTIEGIKQRAYEQLVKPVADKLEGKTHFQNGEQVEYVNAKGETVAGTVTAKQNNTVTVVGIDGKKTETFTEDELAQRLIGETIDDIRTRDVIQVELNGQVYDADVTNIQDGIAELHIPSFPEAAGRYQDVTAAELRRMRVMPQVEGQEQVQEGIKKTDETPENDVYTAGEIQQNVSELQDNESERQNKLAPVITEPSPEQQQEQFIASLPKTKDGEVDYEQIQDDDTFIAALQNEFADDASEIIEEYKKQAEMKLKDAGRIQDPVKRKRAQKQAQQSVDRFTKMYEKLNPRTQYESRVADLEAGNNREREAKMGEYLSLRDYLLRNIATGKYKFRWNENDTDKGLGGELFGTKNQEVERKKRISFLNNNGHSPESLAELIAESAGQGSEINPGWFTDASQIRDEIIDILLSHDTPTAMIDAATELRKQPETYEEYVENFVDPAVIFEYEANEASQDEMLQSLPRSEGNINISEVEIDTYFTEQIDEEEYNNYLNNINFEQNNKQYGTNHNRRTGTGGNQTDAGQVTGTEKAADDTGRDTGRIGSNQDEGSDNLTSTGEATISGERSTQNSVEQPAAEGESQEPGRPAEGQTEGVNESIESEGAKADVNPTEAQKQQQFDIIQASNPMLDDVHTGIRSADEILTAEEAFSYNISNVEDATPDFTSADMTEALRTGKVTVYSSYPIENGVFVTPSKMEAQNFAGEGKVYSKNVPVTNVAWIDQTQGQYADVTAKETAKERKERAKERKERILSEGTTFDKPFNLKPIHEIKSVDDILSNIDKILVSLKSNEGNGKFKSYEGFAYGGKYAKNAGNQISGYLMALDVLPSELRKQFAQSVDADTFEKLAKWAENRYNDISYQHPRLREKQAGPKEIDVEGLFGALRTKGEAKLSDHVKPKEVEKPKGKEAKDSIRKLGTGSNVYFDSNGIRVNDYQNGKVLMNVDSREDFGGPAFWNIEFDTPDEAVKIANELAKIYPNGVPQAVLLDRVVKDMQSKGAEVKPKTDYGANNKIITQERYNELREQMREKLNNLNVGFDPEVFSIGAQMAAYHMEAGARKFADYATRMINDLGENVKPYLKSFYEGVRAMGNEYEGMDSYKYVKDFDVESLGKEVQKKTEEKQTDNQKDDVPLRKGPQQGSLFDNVNTEEDESRQQTDTRADNRQSEFDRGRFPESEQVPEQGVSSEDASRTGESERMLTESGSGQPRTRHEHDVSREYSNEEIHDIVSSVTEIKDGKVEITGEITDDIKTIAGRYKSGGVAKEGRGVLDEYYTSERIVDAVAEILSKYIKPNTNTRALEPSVGIGNFIDALPNKGEIVSFEINETTARIAKILHPNIEVNLRPFETEFIDEKGNKKPMPSKYDIVVGNPPYGQHRGKYKGLGEESRISRYEDYFVKRGLDVLNENGILAMVLPSGWMNRNKLENGYRILDAYRLPTGVFEGTDIGTDIVVLQKGSKHKSKENHNYFDSNPANILGETKERKNRFGRMEEYVDGDIDSAMDALRQNEAKKIASDLHIEPTRDNVNEIDEAVKEATTSDGAKKVVRATRAKKSTATAPESGKIVITPSQLKYEFKRGDEVVPAADQFPNKFSKEESDAFRDTDYSGVFKNPEKHRRYANYYAGKWMHDFYYAEGNIYDRLEQLERDRDNISKEQYDKQRQMLQDVLPDQKTLGEININPNTAFVKNLNLPSSESEKKSLQDRFLEFAGNLPRDAFGSSNYWEVRSYVLNEQVYGQDKARNQLIRDRRKRVGKDLFDKFLSEELTDTQRKQVEYAFNREYNAVYRPDYAKVPMFSSIHKNFRGKPFELTDVQKAGIGRMTVKGVGVLAHEVGFGKTLSAILSMHEAMDRGYTKKPLIVVPNDSILKQWVETINDILPEATVNVLGNLGVKYNLDNFNVNDGEYTIVTYQGFKKLSFGNNVYDKLAQDFHYISDTDLDKQKSTRDSEKEKADIEETVGKMQRQGSYSFEDAGFDYLTFDEIHNANHIVGKVQIDRKDHSDFRSQSQNTSDLGIKTWVAAQYIQQQNDGRNVLLLSATPFTNKPLEYYSILSLVANSTLKRMGFYQVDQFFETFMEADNDLEIAANGKAQQKTNVRRFRNNGLFNQLLGEYIDIKGEQDNPDLVRPERINKEYKIPQNNLTKDALAQAQALLEDGETVLSGLTQSRLIAFSPYASHLSNESPQSHKEFVENSPKIHGTIKLIEQNRKDNAGAGQIVYSELGVDFFPYIRDYLINESKFKASEVAIIAGSTSATERTRIQSEFNKGAIKVILGSPAIKEGMNLQENTTDMYILSLPYNFTQLRQVEGRGWRQGNTWQNIRVNYMLTNDSVDVFMLQRLQIKQGLYNEAMRQGAETIDVSDINTEELKNALITNPETRADLEITVERNRLEAEKERINADLAFILRKHKKFNELRSTVDQKRESVRNYEKNAEKDSWWNGYVEREKRNLLKYENDLQEEKLNIEKKGVNVDDIDNQIEKSNTQIQALDNEIEGLKDEYTKLVDKYRKEREELSKESGNLLERHLQERAKENKEGFYEKRDNILFRSNDIRFRSMDEAGFYSTVEDALRELASNGMPLFRKKDSESRDAYAMREWNRAKKAIDELAAKMGVSVEIIETTDGLPKAKAEAKGWYDTKSKKIAIVMPNHSNSWDAQATFLHEAVGHHGLRELFGEHFDTFLDNVYNNAEEGIKDQIDRIGGDTRRATDEYLSRLAEDQEILQTDRLRGFFNEVRKFFFEMLAKLGFNPGFKLSENELKYILWRSYQNLSEPGRYRSIAGHAKDVSMQHKLKVGNYAEREVSANVAEEPGAPPTRKLNKELFGRLSDAFNNAKTLDDKYDAAFEIIQGIEAVIGGNQAILAKTHEELANIVPGLSTEERQDIMDGLIDGMHTMGEVFLDIEAIDSAGNLISTWFHENAHRITRNVFSDNELEQFIDSINPDYKHLDMLLPESYRDGEKDMQGSEFIARAVEYVLTENSLEDVANNNIDYGTMPDKLRNFVEQVFNNLHDEQSQKSRINTGETRNRGLSSRISNDNRGTGQGNSKEDSGIFENFRTGAYLKQRALENNDGSTEGIEERVNDLFENADNLKKSIPNYPGFLNDVLQGSPAKSDIIANAREKGFTSMPKAIEEYLANVEDPAELSRIKELLGVDMPDNALRYMLWRNANPDDGTVVWKAKEAVKTNELDENILFRKGEVPSSIKNDKYEQRIRSRHNRGFRSLMYGIEEGWLDRMASLRILQDAISGGKSIPDRANAYMLENQLTSRNTADIRYYTKNLVDPFVKQIHDIFGRNMNAADEYMNAKHGLERNDNMAEEEAKRKYAKKIADLGKELSDGKIDEDAYNEKMEALNGKIEAYAEKLKEEKDYSGLTAIAAERGREDFKAVAQEIVAEIEGGVPKEDIDALWSHVNKATKWILDKQYNAGIMTKETYEKIRNMYKYYVPLRGFEEVTATDLYEYIDNSPSNFEGTVKKAYGRTSKADSPTATIMSMGESGIMQANRNRMKQAFYRLVATNPSNYASIEDVWFVKNADGYEERFPEISPTASADEVLEAIADFNNEMEELAAEGQAFRGKNKLDVGVKIMKAQASEHVIRVWIAGEEKVIFINGNPRAAQAINGLVQKDLLQKDNLRHGVEYWSRQMAANFTSRNPAFMVTNLMRDVQFAIVSAAVKDGTPYSMKLAKNVFLVGKTISSNVFGNGNKDNAEFQKYWEEFEANGGETGYANLHSIDFNRKYVNKKLREFSDQRDFLKPFRTYVEFMEKGNRTIEDMSRFATYVTSRQMGRSIERSVSDAKEITINFNRKGSGGFGANLIHSFYLFSNPALQSMRLMGMLAKNHPVRFTAMLSTTMAAGFMVPMINELLLGLFGDDDDKEKYANITPWVRRNNLVLYVPGTDGKFITLMLPHELRAFYGIGEMAYEKANGGLRRENMVMETAKQMTAMLPIDPMGGPDWWVPDALKPPYQAYVTNRNFMDSPIYRDNQWNKFDPEWTKAYKSTPEFLVEAAKGASDMTGGDEVVPGWFNANPARAYHLFSGYLGGFMTTYTDLSMIGFNLLTGREVRQNDIPVVNKLIRTSDEKTEELRINSEYFYYLDWIEEYEHKARGYEKRVQDPEYAEKWKGVVSSKEQRMYNYAKGQIALIDQLKDYDQAQANKKKEEFVRNMWEYEDED